MQANLFPKSTSSKKDLRDYQHSAIVSIFDYFSTNCGSPLVVVPTGGGKSLIIAEFNREANMYFPGTKTVIVSHVALLLEQTASELLNQWPEASISFYSDTLGQKDLSGDVIFAGIQSIYKRAYDFRHTPDLILVDEAHTIGPDDGSMYRKFFDDMLIINPNIKIVGFTATPFRAGYGMLHKGKNALFTHIAYEIPIAELIARGHLCPVVTPEDGVATKMDVQGVKTTKGDYVQTQLAKAVDDEAITRSCVDEIVLRGQDRNKWMVFTVDITHCEHVTEELRSRGIDCEIAHSKMEKTDVSKARDRFKNGSARCLVNVAMLTTGADFPQIDLLAFMRPTRSPVLYIQMAGRGMRTFPGKRNCLLLDFGGVVEELGPIDQVRVREKGDGEGEAPFKYCPGNLPNGNICSAALHAAVMRCPHCGHEFPEPLLNLDTTPSDAAALSSQLKAKKIRVSRLAYFRHKKEGKADSMRVDYLCGFDTYREWKHFDSTQRPREEACAWWRTRAATNPPNSVNEALTRTRELKIPLYISVRKIGTYHEIVGAQFEEGEDEQ